MDPKEVKDALERAATEAVELARRLGADQAEAAVSHDEGLSVTVRMGELESVERQRDRGLAVTVYKDRRKGTASSNDFSRRGIEDVVTKALSIARFTAPDEYAGLADAELMAREIPDLDLYFPSGLAVDAATEIALRAETAAREFDTRIENSEGATVNTGEGGRVYANSHGFVGGYPSSSHSVRCSVIAKRGESLERDYWYTTARALTDLDTPDDVGRECAKR